jgi:hypothetical protein
MSDEIHILATCWKEDHILAPSCWCTPKCTFDNFMGGRVWLHRVSNDFPYYTTEFDDENK